MKRLKSLFSIPALVPLSMVSVFAGERPASAILTYSIYQSGPDVVIQTSGSLNLAGPFTQNICPGPVLIPIRGIICTGPAAWMNAYSVISGPTSFGSGNELLATFSSGPRSTSLAGFANDPVPGASAFYIDPGYVSGSPIISSSTFSAKTLSELGITTNGLLGTWVLATSFDTIEVRAGSPPAVDVPAPLPLLGACAASSFSRRLRRRGRQAGSTAR